MLGSQEGRGVDSTQPWRADSDSLKKGEPLLGIHLDSGADRPFPVLHGLH